MHLCVTTGAFAQAAEQCQPYLRFQVATMRPTGTRLTATALSGWVDRTPLLAVSMEPFDLTSDTHNIVSLLVIVWNGGLKPKAVDKFAASLRREERLHLRLSVLTRSAAQTTWTDDPDAQRRLLEAAAADSSSAHNDAPRYVPATSDDLVQRSRWNAKLSSSIQNLIAQPGKQAILELLPPPPFAPPYRYDHWRIPDDGDYIGESQVHTVAALGIVPVYRVHNDTPALVLALPERDASYSPPLAPSGNLTEAEIDAEEVRNAGVGGVRPAVPERSQLFRDLGGRDLYEAADAMPVLLQDLNRSYTVVIRTPDRCTPGSLFPLQLQSLPGDKLPAATWIAPRWLLQRDLGRPTSDH